jgi:hypothetical protein
MPASTLRHLAKAVPEIRTLQAGGNRREAFNVSVRALQAVLAAEAARRPGETAGLYTYFTEQVMTWVGEMHMYRAVPDDEAVRAAGGSR